MNARWGSGVVVTLGLCLCRHSVESWGGRMGGQAHWLEGNCIAEVVRARGKAVHVRVGDGVLLLAKW